MKPLTLRRTPVAWGAIVATGLIISVLLGCGIKGPPIPPRRPPLPPVTTLQGHLEGDTLTLMWPHPGGQGIKSYLVLRATSPANQPPCQGCPLVFQTIATPPMAVEAQNATFSEQVSAGFVYTYKVRPVGSGGDQGQDSNAVIIDRSVK